MLTNIIKNPIETPRGYKNPDNGIALRGPLSQFLSALYLKPLDDAFDTMDVTYLRYQDDIVIFCQTKRQLERCRQRLMTVLHERRLRLSRKKTRIGCINSGFHFLGIHYPGTQSPDINQTHETINDVMKHADAVHYSSSMGGGSTMRQQLSIYRLCKIVVFHMQEHYATHESTLNKWSFLGLLPAGSGVICSTGAPGG